MTLHGSQRSGGRGVAGAIPAPRFFPLPMNVQRNLAVGVLAYMSIPALYYGFQWRAPRDTWHRDQKIWGLMNGLALNGWTLCGVCSIDNGATHQWPRNIVVNCDQITDLCLAGQALDGQARPLGEAIPVTWGLLEFITNTPKAGASPWRITYAFVRPVPHDGVPPALTQRLMPPLVRRGFGWSEFPGETVDRPFPIPIPVKIVPGRIIPPFPETSVWGPRARLMPGVGAADLSGIAVRAAGKSWVMRGKSMTVTEIIPRADAQVRRIPKPGEKEAKLRVSLNGYPIGRILSNTTEGADIVEAWHKAIDPKCMAGRIARGKRDWYEKRRIARAKSLLARDKTPQAKARRVYQYFDCVNVGKGFWNMIMNELQDTAIGKGAQQLRAANRRAVEAGYLHERPGWQVGPWDTVTRDNRLRRSNSDRNREERQLP